MPRSRRRTKKKTRNIAVFQQRILAATPRHVVERHVRNQFPWMVNLTADEQTQAVSELTDLTVAAHSGTVTAATELQKSIDYWQSIADLTPTNEQHP